MVVEFPLTENYERPLDADQFGTDPDLPQGDSYMDSHCIEIHGLSEENGTAQYGEARVEGKYADRVTVVGYVQQTRQPWEFDVDPIADAKSYDETGGWTYAPGASHGQVVVVLRLDPPEDAYSEGDKNDHTGADRTETADSGNETGGASVGTVKSVTATPTDDGADRADTTVTTGGATAAQPISDQSRTDALGYGIIVWITAGCMFVTYLAIQR